MRNVYFVRHAKSDISVKDGFSRPLTEKGQADCHLVTSFLSDKDIDVIYSSPYKRAYDTVLPFATSVGLPVNIVDDFRERELGIWVDDFVTAAKSMWDDFSKPYADTDGETLREVQQRNINALHRVLEENPDSNIVIGTHGTALSTIINYFNADYGFEDFLSMLDKMPWIVKMKFDGNSCIGIEMFDLF